ncbi:hypothetical protein Taro_020696, partial [Colocasia esculenta]|nr:hypothetical protein [Colocasia esculenta]
GADLGDAGGDREELRRQQQQRARWSFEFPDSSHRCKPPRPLLSHTSSSSLISRAIRAAEVGSRVVEHGADSYCGELLGGKGAARQRALHLGFWLLGFCICLHRSLEFQRRCVWGVLWLGSLPDVFFCPYAV